MPPQKLIQHTKWLILLTGLVVVMTSTAVAQGNMHVVQRGETLYRIALRYQLTLDELVRANNIVNPNRIYVGQTLVIPTEADQTAAPAPNPAPSSAPAAANAPVYHIVQRGETLSAIARRYGVNWQTLANTNSISDPNRILVGQQLTIMVASAPDTAATAPNPAPEPVPQDQQPASAAPPVPVVADNTSSATTTSAPDLTQARTHIVQPGEHLSRIARQYGITWNTIARANNIADPNRIMVGQSLIIPASDDVPISTTYMQPTTGQPTGPTPTITNGKQIIIDLSEQRTYAYQDGQLLRTVTVSTGLPFSPTVLGDYNIYRKLDSQTMQGPGYYLPGVPWVMYFYQGYAIHGTYWHNNFGQPMSHGCVNLPTAEALWFYNFADVGTPVRVIP